MFHLLSDSEVALNELLIACRESVDHYQDATELVEHSDIAESFRQIANQRKLFLNRLESAIRELGDLPSVPDPDKEAGAMILHHLGAALSPDYTNELLAQRIAAEEHILTLIDQARATKLNPSCAALLTDLASHVAQTSKLFSATSIEPE